MHSARRNCSSEAPILLGNAALIATKTNRLDDALAFAQKAEQIAPGEPFAITTLGYVYGLRGDVTHAREQLARLQRVPDAPAYLVAYLLISMGDREDALKELERAVASRDDFVADLGVDPVFDSLHGDPRFDALVARMGLPVPSAARAPAASHQS